MNLRRQSMFFEHLASYDKDDDDDNDDVHRDKHGDADVDDNYHDHDTMTWWWWWRWCWGSLFCFDYGINGVDFKVWFESNRCNPFLFKHLQPSHIIHLKQWRKDTENLNRITQWYEHFPRSTSSSSPVTGVIHHPFCRYLTFDDERTMLFRSAEEAEAKYKTGEAVFFFRYFAVECSDAEMILEESSTWGIKHTRTHTFAEVLDGVHGECTSVHGRDPPPSLHSPF